MRASYFDLLLEKHKEMMVEQEKDREFEARLEKMIKSKNIIHTFLSEDGLYKIKFERVE